MAFVDSRLMRRLNRDFTGHRGLTDVLSFRYDGDVAGPSAGDTPSAARMAPPRSPVIGEVIVSPAFARRYAAEHGLPYRQELARYALHGLLHWLGHDDRTVAQRRWMRAIEDELLDSCS